MEGKIRNFCIIAHIDHGKSTLADRFLELTGTVEKRLMKEQFLDQMELEREKGITIKLQPIRLTYKSPADGQEYMLNLIDTPGHVDFSYEVSRSLAAVEGAILLVDATKGIQAQTLANLKLAQKQHLVIIPAVNKVDLPFARTDEVAKSIAELLRIDEKEIFRISGKTGFNVPHLLEAVVRQVPAAKVETQLPMRALIFDSRFDAFKGVVAYVRVMEGKVLANEAIYLKATNLQAPAKEVGYFTPKEKPTESLKAGEIGYIATGIKEPDRVRIGDTITLSSASDVKSLAGYAKPLPVVFVSFYPEDTDLFDSLKDALWKLKLSDPSNIIQLMANYEGQQLEVNNLDDRTLIVLYEVPLREIVVDFYDKLKSVTQGMASMDYQITEWRDADLVKLEVLVAGEKEEAFSQIVSREKAYREGKALAEKLKDLLPPQQFAVPIQASADGKVIARETIRAKRKDVTAPLYGGDVTRKRKLLDRQKKGKKEMAEK